MSRTFISDSSGTVFISEGGLKGVVRVNDQVSEVLVTMDDLLEFIAEKIRLAKIAELETMPFMDILKGSI